MIVSIAVPVPQPEWARLEGFVTERCLCARLIVWVKEKPQKLFIVGLRGQLRCACLFHLFPSLRHNFSVIVDRIASAVSTQFFFDGVSEKHYCLRQFLFVEGSLFFDCVKKVDFIVSERRFRRPSLARAHDFSLSAGVVDSTHMALFCKRL